jgi:hypothetical protein
MWKEETQILSSLKYLSYLTIQAFESVKHQPLCRVPHLSPYLFELDTIAKKLFQYSCFLQNDGRWLFPEGAPAKPFEPAL